MNLWQRRSVHVRVGGLAVQRRRLGLAGDAAADATDAADAADAAAGLGRVSGVPGRVAGRAVPGAAVVPAPFVPRLPAAVPAHRNLRVARQHHLHGVRRGRPPQR